MLSKIWNAKLMEEILLHITLSSYVADIFEAANQLSPERVIQSAFLGLSFEIARQDLSGSNTGERGTVAACQDYL